MAAIAAWLAGLISSIVSVVAGFIGKKFAMAAIYITVYMTLCAAMLAGVSGAMAGVSYAFPSWASPIINMLPSNTALCLSIVVTTNIVIAAYDAHMTLLKIKMEA
ncbi:DUF5455 family protein [Aeromonas caviae]|uniref:DUF5455 family protein n=1 Tax=Aeromonas caviae TaxID=648 RepID=UPI002B48E2CD|nr:DUF5455 family protein [Aeromonas caviae]